MGKLLRGGNFCTTTGLLTAAGTMTTYDTTETIQYAIGGKAYTKTAITTGATPTTDGNTGLAFPTMGASTASVVVWCLDAAGTVSCRQGSVVSLDVAENFLSRPMFPSIPDTVTPFAYQILTVSDAGSGIIFGSANWDATGFTNAIQNVVVLPDRPQIA